ncbi:GNAT family N-acetyltransferase [Streptomyces tsukubensis]|uniref:GNAT family N-acetyltransferase n=1 Tax=Streptomyces tsukubensis TaxID=83656 RepID=A0A1V4A918_9ACTN|nr:GNAT family N-acetyltransferase [Streptomyces tsukubensis]
MRTVRADEWRQVRELRLDALRDPIAHLAFMETYETAVAQPDSFWRERTAGSADGAAAARQYVAEEAGTGRWVGSVTVLLQEAGGEDAFGDGAVARSQAHIVGVFVRPEFRGGRVAAALFDAAVAWAWSIERVERVRLHVDERNTRAESFYRKAGFLPTGVTLPTPDADATGAREREYVMVRPVPEVGRRPAGQRGSS